MTDDHETWPWGIVVVETTVLGHPCLTFERRRHHLGELILDARRFPEREYVVQGERRLTFAQHERAVAAVAGVLAERGVASGDRVLLLAGNSIEWVVGFWAIVRLDAVVVLGNAWWSQTEVAHAMALTRPQVAIVDRSRAALLPADTPRLDVDELSIAIGSSGAPPELTPTRTHEDDPAVVLFTSGTTGLPKGAVLSHRGLLATLQSLLVRTRRIPLPDVTPAPASTALLSVPLFHIGGLQQILTPLAAGGCVVFSEGRFDPATIVGLIEREQISVWSAVPTMASRVIEHLERSGRGPVESLSTLGLGGSPVVEELRRKVQQWFPRTIRGLAVTYGLSEACGVVSTGAGPEITRRPGTVGQPLSTCVVRIADPDDTGAGEVLVRSPSVMLGYVREATQAGGLAVDPGPITPDRWLHTGDIGRLDADGYLFISDRSKDIVIRGGENIASPHVENRLLQHPAVRECAVIGLPHPTLGEEVGAVVVVVEGAEVTTGDLAEFAAAELAYFEVPTKWDLRREALPQNATGKILKRVVRDEWLQKMV